MPLPAQPYQFEEANTFIILHGTYQAQYIGDHADVLKKENERVVAEKAAQSITASMFPWERRQMDGGSTPLNRFERVYWIAFGGAVAFIVGSNVYRYFTSKKEVVVRQVTALTSGSLP